MAGTITATIGFQVSKDNYTLEKPEEAKAITWNEAEGYFITSEGIMLVTSGSAGEVLPFGDIALGSVGWVWLRNLHASASIEIGPQYSGAVVPLIKLNPGEVAMFRHNQTEQSYAKASAASTPLEYRIFSD